MKTNRIFAEDIKACPKCGATDFYQDWAGGEDYMELVGIACKNCGEYYPTERGWINKDKEPTDIDENKAEKE